MTYIVDMKDVVMLVLLVLACLVFVALWAVALIGEAVRKWQQKKIDAAYKEEDDG